MPRNALTQARVSAGTRTSLVYPRNPMGAVYIPGAKSIEGATGDVATTTNDTYIENRKFNWLFNNYAGASSAEFDTAVTRTGAKVLKVSTTNDTGSNSVTTTFPNPKIVLKPSTQYTLSCWVKTNNVANNSVYLRLYDGSPRNTNTLSGTVDWTLCTVTWTTGATPQVDYLHLRMLPGATGDAWADVNSMTLVETGVTRGAVV